LKIPLHESIELLRELIRIPSFSGEEKECSDFLFMYLRSKGLDPERIHNNILLRNQDFNPRKKTILLNSHLDTVRTKEGWTQNPFEPVSIEGKLYGLGSNDAGGCLISLLSVFFYFYDQKDLNYNLVFLASAEEEISGNKGVVSVLPLLEKPFFGIVGEPTRMQMAVAERGLMVLDCQATGRAGHAAHHEGINAIYLAMADIEWIRNFQFPSKSDRLGDIKMSVTMIRAGHQHNVIPDYCEFVVDVRSTDLYTNEQILDIIIENLSSEVKARSTRLQSSAIREDHILVKTAQSLGISLFGSGTLSDQALMNFPTVKIGPGDSVRSHTTDEFIRIDEIKEGIAVYKKLLEQILI
jgi:acetylornithine deacetylase